MNETKEVSLFPRDEGEYVINETLRRILVNHAVSKKTGVDFPSMRESSTLAVFQTKPLRDLLTQRGFEFADPEELKSLIEKLKLSANIKMFVRWSFNDEESGVMLKLFIELKRQHSELNIPHSLWVRSPELIRAIQDTPAELHTLASELLSSNGVQRYSWSDLGIEPHIPARDLFNRFIEERFDNENAVKIRRLAGYNETHKVFDPEPWQRDPTRADFVPESAQEQLLAQWDEQLRAFAMSITPK